MDIASRISAIRKEMHLSQEKFGALVGMSQRSVAAWEAGDRIPSYDVLIELSDKLNISVDYLMGRSDARQTKTEPVSLSENELRAKVLKQISDLSDAALFRVSDFLSGLEAGQEILTAPPAVSNQSAGSTAQSAAGPLPDHNT